MFIAGEFGALHEDCEYRTADWIQWFSQPDRSFSKSPA